MKIKSLVISLIIISQHSIAANPDDEYVVIGQESCGKYLKSDKQTKLYFKGWLNGFLSAYNQYQYSGINVAASVDSESIDIWLVKYCQENPLSSYYQASQSLIKELESK